MRIIHITGVSGSGKSTLGERLRHKKFYMIDTDVIEDHNCAQVLKTKKITTEKQKKSFYETVDKKNSQDYFQLIKKHGPTQDILIVGMVIQVEMVIELLKKHKIDYKLEGYFIDVPAEQVFRQVNSRNLELICKNAANIKRMIQNCNSLDDTELMDINLGIQYKIRGRFPITLESIKSSIKKQKARARDRKYKILHPDVVYKLLIS